MDGFYLQADAGRDESTWRYRVRRRISLLILRNLITARPELIDDDAAGIRWWTRPWWSFAAQTESVVCRTQVDGWLRWNEHVRLRNQRSGIELQCFVVARRQRCDLIVVWWLLTTSLIGDGDDMNRVVILQERIQLNLRDFNFFHRSLFLQFIESLKAFSRLPRAIIVGH